MSKALKTGDLRLEPLPGAAGEEVPPSAISGSGPILIGRARECEVCLKDPSVSRRHASLVERDGRWFVTDLGARQGTFLNGVRLRPDSPAVTAPGDFIRVGPYTFRFGFGPEDGSTVPTSDRNFAAGTIVESVPTLEIDSLAQRRLELLIDGAAAIQQVSSEEGLARSMLDLALAGTGYPRAAVLRATSSPERVEVVAARDSTEEDTAAFTFSRSLLREASSGRLARMSGHTGQLGQSLERLGINHALCAPIILDTTVIGYIYLDSRHGEQSGYADAAGFCQAISRLASLAFSNLKRAELQQRQGRLEEDLEGARQAQAFLCPSEGGSVGNLRYAVHTQPGRVVAGDLFDIFKIDEGRAGICFGDVSGQGMSAAIHMTAALSHLRAALARYGDPARAANDVNRYIAQRSPANMFVSLWVGVFDEARGALHYVDAGHGHWMLKRNQHAPLPAGRPDGLLVGIEPDYRYTQTTLSLQRGDRIVLYSDGVLEQTSPRGEEFGYDRAYEVLAKAGSSAEDVSFLFDALREFAATPSLADDTTVASIEVAECQEGNGQ
ncbi:MAG: SpoIIE family protein phosphatase [Planctomycetota bacterium]|jgi:serine phosphatase RsbU (regulator of sigma subunit)/pSer/pThr/pTyr-binding forkhead associated (FHA) protein